MVAVAIDVESVIVVEKPKRIEIFHLRLRALLPVNPPKINAHLFVRMVQNIEVRVAEFLVGEVKFERALRLRVYAERAAHFGVLFLEIANAVAGVQVHRDRKIATFEVLQKSLGIGEQFLFKRISRPPCALKRFVFGVLWHVVYDVPVHIYRGDGERHVLLLEFVHKFEILFVGVGVIARPPVAENVFGKNGRESRKRIKLFESAEVVPSERENVLVFRRRRTRRNAAVNVENNRRRIVYFAHAVQCEYTFSDMRNAKMVFLFASAFPAAQHAERAVQRPRRAAEIERVRGRRALAVFESDGRRKRLCVYVKKACFRFNRYFIAVFCILKLRICVISAKCELRAIVRKTTLFYTQRSWRKHAYAHVADDNRILFFARCEFLRKPHIPSVLLS